MCKKLEKRAKTAEKVVENREILWYQFWIDRKVFFNVIKIDFLCSIFCLFFRILVFLIVEFLSFF